jgi:hypothetical protein
MMTAEDYQQQWGAILTGLSGEVALLAKDERLWMTSRLARIGRLQRRLHRLFLAAGGLELCRRCQGDCCGCGRNHMTLINLLPFVLADEAPPAMDFSRTCPYSGDSGCLLEPSRRPFNCVIFLCEEVEAALSSAQRHLFLALEGRLRDLYLEFDHRYAGSSLRGLFIRNQTLGGAPFLSPPANLLSPAPLEPCHKKGAPLP